MRATTETNISACYPHLPPEDQQKLAKASLIETGKCLLEMPKMWGTPFKTCQQWIHAVSNEHLLTSRLSNSKGLLLILPHLGNWEIVNHYLVGQTKLTAMYKPAKQPLLEQVILKARSLPNTDMVPANATGVKAVLKTLKAGGTSVLLADQEPTPPSGLFVPFFGVPAYTGVLAARVVQKTQCQVLIIFGKRLPKARGFEICLRSLPSDISPDHSQEDITTNINQGIEHCVEEARAQYQWEYKRFKRRPDEAENFYV